MDDGTYCIMYGTLYFVCGPRDSIHHWIKYLDNYMRCLLREKLTLDNYCERDQDYADEQPSQRNLVLILVGEHRHLRRTGGEIKPVMKL